MYTGRVYLLQFSFLCVLHLKNGEFASILLPVTDDVMQHEVYRLTVVHPSFENQYFNIPFD